MDNREQNLLKRFKKQKTGFSREELKSLSNRIAEEYYKLSDPEDIPRQMEYLAQVLHNEKKIIEHGSDSQAYSY